jgi:hypothetical protein
MTPVVAMPTHSHEPITNPLIQVIPHNGEQRRKQAKTRRVNEWILATSSYSAASAFADGVSEMPFIAATMSDSIGTKSSPWPVAAAAAK